MRSRGQRFSSIVRLVRNGVRRRLTTVGLAAVRATSRDASRLCNICDKPVRRFVDSRCAFCGSLPRHRLIAYTFGQVLPAPTGGTVVHIGAIPIERRWVEVHVRPAEYHRVDILEGSDANLIADATDLPLPSATVDLTIAWHVLEHIPNDRLAIAELFRVLRPGGHFLMSVPIYPARNPTTFEDLAETPEARERLFGFHEHVRGCGTDYGDRLRDAGFEVTTIQMGSRPSGDRDRLGLSPTHYAWIGKKPVT